MELLFLPGTCAAHSRLAQSGNICSGLIRAAAFSSHKSFLSNVIHTFPAREFREKRRTQDTQHFCVASH